MKTLKLTSPHMRGPDVKKLQEQLKKRKWLQGAVDGEYGPDTARAVYRAKYWLGYRKPDKVAGDLLMSYLTGARKPSKVMEFYRARRLRLAAEKPLRLKMLEESLKLLGTSESPAGSNRNFITSWYRLIGPWCAMVISYVGVKAGSKTFIAGKFYAYCPYMEYDARRGVNNLALTYNPQSGNIVLFDWQKDRVADHTGLWASDIDLRRLAPIEYQKAVRTFGPLGAGDFWCVEGNTAVGNDSNGGKHMIRKRDKSQVRCYINVGR